MANDVWNADTYERFAAERRLPFDELVSLCEPLSGDRVVYDLGCGPGTLTAELPERLGSSLVVGVDASDAMLARARALAEGRNDLDFEAGDLAGFEPTTPPSLIISNAALHWVERHHEVLDHWRRSLATDGQIAVQVPTNHDHPAYPLASAVAAEHADWFPDGVPDLPSTTVLAPEHYATILHGLGAKRQHVALRVFTHELDRTGDVVEWLSGTTLNSFRSALAERAEGDGAERFAEFCEAYRQRLLVAEGVRQPYLFTFKRILMWARF